MHEEDPRDPGLADRYDEIRKAMILDKSQLRLREQIQQLNHDIAQLRATVDDRNSEIQRLTVELEKQRHENREIQERADREITALQQEHNQLIQARSTSINAAALQTTISELQTQTHRLADKIRGLEVFSIGAITGVPDAAEKLREYLYRQGNPENKVLLSVLDQGECTKAQIGRSCRKALEQIVNVPVDARPAIGFNQ